VIWIDFLQTKHCTSTVVNMLCGYVALLRIVVMKKSTKKLQQLQQNVLLQQVLLTLL
jgi:hypothetical protein